MLALLIKVVREMVFTLGKWSFSKKSGKFTSYYGQGSNPGLGQQVQRLNSQHTCHWGTARGLFTESAARLTPGLDQELPQPCLCQTQRRTRESRFSSGPSSQARGRDSGNTLALTEKDACDVWQPLQIWNKVNDSSEPLVQLHWVIWNLWFMN